MRASPPRRAPLRAANVVVHGELRTGRERAEAVDAGPVGPRAAADRDTATCQRAPGLVRLELAEPQRALQNGKVAQL